MVIAAIPLANALTTAPGLYVPASTPVTPRTSGAVGTPVCVVGNATHGQASPFTTVTIYWRTLSGPVLGTISADASGNYKINVTIPSAVAGGAAAGNYIVAQDDGVARGAVFTVTPSLRASTTPPTAGLAYHARVLPGDALTVTGNGYAANSAVTVTLENSTDELAITSPAVTTNGTGSFSATITVPSIGVASYGVWTVNATDASDNFATAPILIDYYVTVAPTSGSSGITITVSGRIPANQAYTVLIDTTTIASGLPEDRIILFGVVLFSFCYPSNHRLSVGNDSSVAYDDFNGLAYA
jgi:hypothetical protein